MSIKQQLYSCSNVITELSKLLSDRIQNDVELDKLSDRNVLIALADGINLAAYDIDELVSSLSDPPEQIEAQ